MRADFLTIVLCNSALISEFSGPDAGVSRFMFRSAFLMVNDLFEPLSDKLTGRGCQPHDRNHKRNAIARGKIKRVVNKSMKMISYS